MYYIRRLSKCSNLYKIKNCTYHDLPADILYQEMRTTSNTLSVWHCDELGTEEYYHALYAALLTGSSLEATQFLIVSSDELERIGIEYLDKANPSGYIGMDNHHTDLCNLDVDKICQLLELFCSASKKASRTPKIEKPEFEQIVKELDSCTLLDFSPINDHLAGAINRCLSKNLNS